MNVPKASEVVVIGGGFLGASTAYHLAKQGVEVTVVDRSEISRQASGSNWGYVWVQTQPAGHSLDLALASATMYETLSDELGYDIEYEKCGGMMVLEEEGDLDAADKVIAQQSDAGVDVRLVDREELRQMEPKLSRDLVGAVYSPMDAKINPLFVNLGLVEGVKKHGGTVLSRTRARAIEMKNGEIQSVVTDRGRIKTRKVVNAAGVWARKIGSMVGIDIPIVCHQGEVMVTEPLPPVISHLIYSGSYVRNLGMVIMGDPSLVYQTDDPMYRFGFNQHARGDLTIGNGIGIRAYSGFDKRSSYEIMKECAEWAIRVLPPVKNAHIVRSWAAVLPGSVARAGGGVIIDEVNFGKSAMFLVIETGFGVLRCPIDGKLAAELITAGRENTSLPIEECRLFRYAKEDLF